MMSSNILIVEDSVESVDLLKTILELSLDAVVIRTALDGEFALDVLNTFRPDLILLDAVLPGISGFDVCKHLKSKRELAHIPVLMISGVLVEREHRITGFDEGADGYLCKPFQRDELVAQVRTLLRMKQYQDTLLAHEVQLSSQLDEQTQQLTRSERYLRSLFEHSADAIFVEDFEGNVLDCNAAAARLHDMPVDALIGVNVLDLVPAEQRDEVAGRFLEWTDSLTTFEGWRYTRSGLAVPVEVHGSRVEYGGKDALLLHVRDISQRREAEVRLSAHQKELESLVEERTAALRLTNAKLDQSRADFHSLVEQSMEGVLVLDPEGTVLYANPAAAVLLQTHLDLLVGQAFDYHIDLGREVQIETERADGGRSLIEALYSETEWHGKGARLVTLRDVTLRRMAEKQMLRSDHLESLGVLAGGIAHDFNNLLSGIVGNISYAALPETTAQQCSRALNEAEGAAGRAKTLTHQLLTFARGGAPLREITNVEELLEETTRFSLVGSNCASHIVAESGLWSAYIDVSQIGQVIENLFINAAQAMPRGGTIDVNARNFALQVEGVSRGLNLEAGLYIEVSFHDSGVGIDSALLPKIFDPYFSTKEDGSGLGLAICYSIMAKHGGDLVVESKPGQGSTFTLYLPATMETKEPVMTDREAPTSSGVGKRVLVMDDEEIIRNLLTHILELLHYTSRCVPDGKAAVDAYVEAAQAGEPFDVVILDLTIPGGMGGEETLAELYKVDPNVRALVSSGYSASSVFSGYESHGFVGSIAKPYNVRDLAAALSKALSG
ncbi:MAG: two-component system cell cycle sensor histidine kinase/response regulator CckA [Kiritimatiellia bacterium]|jgi:two-component system cell cycle sensor histidine kinase/response regulator CckA